MGFSGLDRYSYEHENFEKEEKILGYIILKGCAWATDIARNLLIDVEQVNKLLAKMSYHKIIEIVTPFERFSPPEIVMTRAKDLFTENNNSLTPENWPKRAFFYASDEGFHNFCARNKGKNLKAHNIYLNMYSIILEAVKQEKQDLNSQGSQNSNV